MDLFTRITRELETERACACPGCVERFPATHIARDYCSQRCQKKAARLRTRARDKRETLSRLSGRLALNTLELKRLGMSPEEITTYENRLYPDAPAATTPNGSAAPPPTQEPPPAPTLDFSTLTPPHDPYEKYLKK